MIILCPSCGRKYELSNSYLGKKFKCEICGYEVYIDHILCDYVDYQEEKIPIKKYIIISSIIGVAVITSIIFGIILFK